LITFFTIWLSSSFLAAGAAAPLSAPVSTFLEGTTVLSSLASLFLSSSLSEAKAKDTINHRRI